MRGKDEGRGEGRQKRLAGKGTREEDEEEGGKKHWEREDAREDTRRRGNER